MAEARLTLMHGFRQSFFLLAPAMAGLLILREPIVRLLFEWGAFGPADTARAANALLFYGLGLLSYGLLRVSVQGFYAVQDTKTPVIAASLSMLLNIVLNVVLVGPLGYAGLALATALSFTVNFLAVYVLLIRRYGPLWDRALLGGLGRMIGAVAVMALMAIGLHQGISAVFARDEFLVRVLAVAVPIGGAAAIYGGLCKALGVEEADQFLRLLRRREA